MGNILDRNIQSNFLVNSTIGECWLSCIEHILTNGKVYKDEDVNIHETLGLTIEINNPSMNDPIIDKYGDGKIISSMLAKFSKGIVMPNRPFTYGERIYNHMKVDQFEWLVDRLTKKKETKSATICLLIPGDTSPNLPCLTTIDVKIRDEKLELQVFFRSQNIFGRQYANLLALVDLQSKLAQQCCVEMGKLRCLIASAHIYEFDIDDAKKVILGDNLRIKDNYYLKGPKSIRS